MCFHDTIDDIADELFELRNLIVKSQDVYLTGMPHIHKAEQLLATLEKELTPVESEAGDE